MRAGRSCIVANGRGAVLSGRMDLEEELIRYELVPSDSSRNRAMALTFFSPLHKASRQLSIYIQQQNASSSLSPHDAHLLTYLCRYAPTPVGELIRVFGFKQSTFTSILDRLEKPGFIRREMNAEDRRSFLIHITPQGRELADHITKQLVDIEKAISGKVSKQDVQGFQAVMAAIGVITQVHLRGREPSDATDATDTTDTIKATGGRRSPR